MEDLNFIKITGQDEKMNVNHIDGHAKYDFVIRVKKDGREDLALTVEKWDPKNTDIVNGDTVSAGGRLVVRKFIRPDGTDGVYYFLLAGEVSKESQDAPHNNLVKLVGHVGRACDNPGGVSFSLATNQVYMDRYGGAVIETTWHMVSVLKGTDGYEAAKGFLRGDQTAVNGSLRAHTYVNADGNECVRYEVVADSVTKIIPVEDQ